MRGAAHSVTASDDMLADNGALHDEVLAMFSEIFRGKQPVPLPSL
jgi:hypothetical protein